MSATLGRLGSHAALPTIVVVAAADSAESVRDLFARRGFQVVVAPSLATFTHYMVECGATPAGVILDFVHPDAWRVLRAIKTLTRSFVVVAIAAEDEVLRVQQSADAVFVRPVDPARLFVCVIELVALKRGKRKRKLTGIVGAVDGNDLFLMIARELHSVVPPVNSGAILERVLRELGSGPFVLGDADLDAMLASGRLAEALTAFGESTAILAAMQRIADFLKGRPR